MNFKDDIAVVTGGTTGIGKACCLRLKEEGASVYNLDIAEDGSREIPFIKCDVRNYTEVQTAVSYIFEKEGKIDLLFANAGIHVTGNIEETSVEEFENVLSVNSELLNCSLQANKLQDLFRKTGSRNFAAKKRHANATSDISTNHKVNKFECGIVLA